MLVGQQLICWSALGDISKRTMIYVWDLNVSPAKASEEKYCCLSFPLSQSLLVYSSSSCGALSSCAALPAQFMLSLCRRVMTPVQVAHMHVTSYPGHADNLGVAEVRPAISSSCTVSSLAEHCLAVPARLPGSLGLQAPPSFMPAPAERQLSNCTPFSGNRSGDLPPHPHQRAWRRRVASACRGFSGFHVRSMCCPSLCERNDEGKASGLVSFNCDFCPELVAYAGSTAPPTEPVDTATGSSLCSGSDVNPADGLYLAEDNPL